jgi:hypothetical protein
MVNNLPAPALAEVLFRAETFVDKNPRRVFEEEYIHKLNQFRQLSVKIRLKEAKEKQRQLEEVGDIEAAVALSSEIMTGQKELQETPLTRDFLKVN